MALSSFLSLLGLPVLLSLLVTASPTATIKNPSLVFSRDNDGPIECSPWALPTRVPWPTDAPRPRTDYASVHELCQHDSTGHRPTVGCLCDASGINVECRADRADPVLFYNFQFLCKDRCRCPGQPVQRRPMPAALLEAFRDQVTAAQSGNPNPNISPAFLNAFLDRLRNHGASGPPSGNQNQNQQGPAAAA